MALNTYANLQTAVIAALHRSDLTANVPDFITLAEDKLNKRLRIRAMRQRVTSSVSTEYVSLPSGFLSIANIQVNTNPRTRLEYATPEWLDLNYGSTSVTGEPKFYTLVGGEIQLAPAPDTSYTLEIDYYKALDLATDLTNWVLSNAPRCYYYGALMEAAGFLVNDKRVPLWGTMLESALKEVEAADSSDEYPSYGLQIRPESAPS